ncbi:MAG TPA: SLBB domain-containing protein [Phycisphaerae bacterium]|nr:SLBB domain-containing protein [Phycisphaerae bacterium]HRY68753.1 SLBB domain-containing protein [Phycisphaerae bacterium]HSA28924.1 SLBB domain-containing protein [Phycisphaerae bacterium]
MAEITIDTIQSCGVVGAGGAGFPTHVKLRAAAEVIILNAAECEPLLHKDKEMLREFPDQVIAGLERARQLVGAKEAVIGIKYKYHDVIELLTPKLPATMRIAELADSYPTGDEFILVYDVTGRVIPPGRIPLAVGAVVTNVETAYNIAQGVPVTHKFLTVAGAVRDPVTIGVPVGTSFREAIELAGGATVDKPAALVGGVMMGRLCTSFDEPITKTTGGLIVLPDDHMLIARYRKDWPTISRVGASACDQCSFCTELCPRYLLGHPIEPHKAMRSLVYSQTGEASTLGTLFCCECNLCTMISCPEDLDPKSVCGQNKRRLMSEGRKWEVDAVEARPRLHLDNRRVPLQRLLAKLGLADFVNKGPMLKRPYQPRRVHLPLKQHVGAPALPVVRSGDQVTAGDVVARPSEGQLGAVIHASITGTVSLAKDAITIEA